MPHPKNGACTREIINPYTIPKTADIYGYAPSTVFNLLKTCITPTTTENDTICANVQTPIPRYRLDITIDIIATNSPSKEPRYNVTKITIAVVG